MFVGTKVSKQTTDWMVNYVREKHITKQALLNSNSVIQWDSQTQSVLKVYSHHSAALQCNFTQYNLGFWDADLHKIVWTKNFQIKSQKCCGSSN